MEKSIKLHSNEEAIALYGDLDKNLRHAEKEYSVRISARNDRLKISGGKYDVEKAFRFFMELLREYRTHKHRVPLRRSTDIQKGEGEAVHGRDEGTVFYHRGKMIRAKSKNQQRYLESIRNYDVVFSIGPAGTGKTYLGMAAALDFLKRKMVSRIILVRPAVEAGESLGYLPGDLYEKVNPYLRPLYDALYDMADVDEAARYLDRGMIEVAPLAFMRGRTLNDSFVILDEAQNTTHEQMKMFLTRLGRSSKTVVCGDITQIDLPGGKRSGLVEAKTVLARTQGIKFVTLDQSDVVRHPLVQEIIRAYEKSEHKHRT